MCIAQVADLVLASKIAVLPLLSSFEEPLIVFAACYTSTNDTVVTKHTARRSPSKSDGSFHWMVAVSLWHVFIGITPTWRRTLDDHNNKIKSNQILKLSLASEKADGRPDKRLSETIWLLAVKRAHLTADGQAEVGFYYFCCFLTQTLARNISLTGQFTTYSSAIAATKCASQLINCTCFTQLGLVLVAPFIMACARAFFIST